MDWVVLVILGINGELKGVVKIYIIWVICLGDLKIFG